MLETSSVRSALFPGLLHLAFFQVNCKNHCR